MEITLDISPPNLGPKALKLGLTSLTRISLSSSIRAIYRKSHQNRTSSSRVIEEQTYRHTLPFYS